MRNPTILRAFLLTVALLSALSAQAVTIGLTSQGSATNDGFAVTETVLAQVGGYGPLDSLALNITEEATNPLGGEFSGVGTYTGSGGTLNFSFEFGAATFNNGSEILYPGAWTATGGTGSYLGATGKGVLSVNYFGPAQNRTFTTLTGNVQAVPEPASLAALGLGGAAFLRRRKKG